MRPRLDGLTQARADSEFAAEAGADVADGEEDGQENKPTGPAWEGTDRDYSYEELLGESSQDYIMLKQAQGSMFMTLHSDYLQPHLSCLTQKLHNTAGRSKQE